MVKAGTVNVSNKFNGVIMVALCMSVKSCPREQSK